MVEESFGSYLRGLRKRVGLSQRDLAGRAGIDFTYLSKIENDRVDPPGEATLRALAGLLGVEADDLFARARKAPRDLKRLLAQGTPEKALLLRRIAQTELTPERVQRLLRLLEEEEPPRSGSPIPGRANQGPGRRPVPPPGKARDAR
jgi:HTH-type transcriptional regulator, competence development regulator